MTRIALLLLLVSLFLGSLLPAQDSARVPILRTAELKPGMRGHGYSVFRGTERERFGVTILGVLKNNQAGTDMILAELDHPIMNDIGVIAGMSGSPVYVDGKLVGAVAFGWGFSVRPVCGIQPIEGMLRVMDAVQESPTAPAPLPAPQGWDASTEVQPSRVSASMAAGRLGSFRVTRETVEALGIEPPTTGAEVTFEPLSVPLQLSSADPLLLAEAQRLLGGLAMQPVAGGGSASYDIDAAVDGRPMVGGDAVGVMLCEGDLSLMAIGTLTYAEGDRAVAFGHPMFGTGAVDMPAVLGNIVAIAPTVSRPFKLATGIARVGAVHQDRDSGIGITRNRTPSTIPMQVVVRSREFAGTRSFRYRLWPHESMLPGIAGTALSQAIVATSKEAGVFTLDTRTRIDIAGHAPLEYRTFVSGETLPLLLAGFTLSSDLQALVRNSLHSFGVTGIQVDVTVGDAVQAQAVRSVRIDTPEVAPGGTVEGEIEFLTWRGPDRRERFSIRVPETLRDGRYVVSVLDSTARTAREFTSVPELGRLKTPEDFLRRLRVHYPENGLWVTISEVGEQAVLDDQSVAGMPTSVMTATSITSRSGGAMMRTAAPRVLVEKPIFLPSQVAGSANSLFEVRRSR